MVAPPLLSLLFLWKKHNKKSLFGLYIFWMGSYLFPLIFVLLWDVYENNYQKQFWNYVNPLKNPYLYAEIVAEISLSFVLVGDVICSTLHFYPKSYQFSNEAKYNRIPTSQEREKNPNEDT